MSLSPEDELLDLFDYQFGNENYEENPIKEVSPKAKQEIEKKLKKAKELAMRKWGEVKTEEETEKTINNKVIGITNTNVHASYAAKRIENSKGLSKWPPRMLELKRYIDQNYKRKSLCTELAFPMLELCLKLPNSFLIEREDKKIPITSPNVINYNDKCFENAFEILIDLLNMRIVDISELRVPFGILINRGTLNDEIVKKMTEFYSEK